MAVRPKRFERRSAARTFGEAGRFMQASRPGLLLGASQRQRVQWISAKGFKPGTTLYVFKPVHTARSGQESLAQGSPWVWQKKVLSPEGARDTRNAAQGPVASRSSLCIAGPFRADSGGKFTPGKPGAMFHWPLRARIYVLEIWKCPNRWVRRDALLTLRTKAPPYLA
jgi:hypothetical protein